MHTHGKRLLDHLTTSIAFLRGVVGVHSNDLMSGTCSLGSENIKERCFYPQPFRTGDRSGGLIKGDCLDARYIV